MINSTELDYKAKALLPDWAKDGDLSVSIGGELFFLTNVFKDGHVLGFWSHSPCGRVHDQEQGWALISPDKKVVDSCETKSYGMPAGNDFRQWRRAITAEYGKSKKLTDRCGSQFWKIAGL